MKNKLQDFWASAWIQSLCPFHLFSKTITIPFTFKKTPLNPSTGVYFKQKKNYISLNIRHSYLQTLDQNLKLDLNVSLM